MDEFMIFFRLIHIFAGVFWVGWGAYMLLFMVPTVQNLGQDGGKVMSVLLRTTPWAIAMPIVAVLTAVSGIALYWKVSDTFNADWMELDSSIVLSIGAVAGLLAVGHGGATVGRATTRMKALAETMAAAGGPPTPEQAAELTQLRTYIGLHSRIAFSLTVIALLAMSTWRYF